MKQTLFLGLSLLLYSCFYFCASAKGRLSANTILALDQIEKENTVLLKSQSEAIDSFIHAYVILENGTDPYSIEQYGANVSMVTDSIVSARIPINSIDNILSLKGVKVIDTGGKVETKLDIARGAVLDDKIRESADLPKVYSGDGVIVGIIDIGLQMNHINFFDENGDLRIKRAWLQSATGTPPEEFGYGKELKSQEDIISLKYDNQSETHASVVTGIAAGCNKDKGYYGIADKSEIVYVSIKTNDNSTGFVPISDGVKYIYDYAESVNKPCVINMSLGDVYGPHDGSSIFDKVCDNLQGNGRLLVGSAGNEGSNTQHISKTFTSEQDTLRSYFSMITNYGSGYRSQSDFYGEIGKKFSIKLCILNYGTGNIVNESVEIPVNVEGVKDIRFEKVGSIGASATIVVISETEVGSGRPHISILAQLTKVTAGYTLGFKLFGENGTLHGWADDTYSRFTGSTNIAGWSAGDTNSSIAEIGGTGKRIITVGSYKTRDFTSSPSNIGGISSFSSKGPTIDGRIKPDVTAPGEWVISSFSDASNIVNDPYYSARIKEGDSVIVKGVKYLFAPLRGTSMAAPIVTGALALWLEAKPDLSPESVRDIIKKTAIKDKFTGTEPGNTWGYGKFDAWNGLKSVLKLSSINESEYYSDDDMAKVFVSGGVCNILFTKDIKRTTVKFYNLYGQLVMSEYLGDTEAGNNYDFDLNHSKGNIYIVNIYGDNFNKSYKVTF